MERFVEPRGNDDLTMDLTSIECVGCGKPLGHLQSAYERLLKSSQDTYEYYRSLGYDDRQTQQELQKMGLLQGQILDRLLKHQPGEGFTPARRQLAPYRPHYRPVEYDASGNIIWTPEEEEEAERVTREREEMFEFAKQGSDVAYDRLIDLEAQGYSRDQIRDIFAQMKAQRILELQAEGKSEEEIDIVLIAEGLKRVTRETMSELRVGNRYCCRSALMNPAVKPFPKDLDMRLIAGADKMTLRDNTAFPGDLVQDPETGELRRYAGAGYWVPEKKAMYFGAR